MGLFCTKRRLIFGRSDDTAGRESEISRYTWDVFIKETEVMNRKMEPVKASDKNVERYRQIK